MPKKSAKRKAVPQRRPKTSSAGKAAPRKARPATTRIAIQLNPEHLSNPDLDIRYKLPDLLVKQSRGVLVDDGYDYVQEEDVDLLVLFLRIIEADRALTVVLEVVEKRQVLQNRLRKAAVVAVKRQRTWEVVYPTARAGESLTLG